MTKYLLLLLVFGFASCYDYSEPDYNIYVNNQSSCEIVACCGYFYPDTTFERYLYHAEIGLGARGIILQYNSVLNLRPENRNDTLSVFILSAATVLNNDWHSIATNYNILIRYELSNIDIKKLNSIIPFPPSQAMKDMKMYPPYEKILKEVE